MNVSYTSSIKNNSTVQDKKDTGFTGFQATAHKQGNLLHSASPAPDTKPAGGQRRSLPAELLVPPPASRTKPRGDQTSKHDAVSSAS